MFEKILKPQQCNWIQLQGQLKITIQAVLLNSLTQILHTFAILHFLAFSNNFKINFEMYFYWKNHDETQDGKTFVDD